MSGAGSLARPTLRVGQLTAWMRSPAAWGLGVFVVAAAFRLYGLDDGHSSPYYDAAVRSMGQSWHNFFFAAFEPGGAVAIDKPPLDLWLQVATTKLFGFGIPALLLPQALAGSAAAVLVFDLVRRSFGTIGGIAAGLVLATLPISVVTARSDTMDSLMMALAVLALWLVARSVERTKARYLYLGAFVAGLAFEVKLIESLIAVPALVVLYAIGSSEPLGRRARNLLVAGLVFLVSAAWWPLAVTLAPGHKPYALGSTNGSFLNATFVFNGVDRLKPAAPSPRAVARADHTSQSGPLRLLDAHRSRYMQDVGFVLVAAAVLAALAVALSIGRRTTKPRRALGWALLAWLVPAVFVLSEVGTLHPRYLEALTPAAAAAVGASAGVVMLRRPRVWIAVAAAILIVGLTVGYGAQRSAALVQRNASDAGHVGAFPPGVIDKISAYLAPRTRGDRYEVVSDYFPAAGALIVKDGRPLLIAMGTAHYPVTPLSKIKAEVAAGHVHYTLFNDHCGFQKSVRRCTIAGRWLRQHGKDVTRAAGAGSHGVLFTLHP